MTRLPELPSHQPPTEQKRGEGRIPESIHSSVRISYEPRLASGGHALEYANLEVQYQEETVRPGRRGLMVVRKSEPGILRVEGAFAMLDVAAVEGQPGVYELALHLDSNALSQGGIDKYKALPLAAAYIKPDKLNKIRQEGGLIGYLQVRMPDNFELDLLKAALGDNREKWENKQAQNEEVLFQELLTKWSSLKTTSATRADKPSYGRDIRQLTSPLVRKVMKRLLVENPHQS